MQALYTVHKNVGYMLKCKENLIATLRNYYKTVQTYQNCSEKDFLKWNVKMKDIFTKWFDFLQKLCALHRRTVQNVVNASLEPRL